MASVMQPVAWRLREYLSALTVDQLKWYAALLPGEMPSRKGELVDRIEERLRDPGEVRQLWAALSRIEQHVVAEAVHRLNGRYDDEVIPAKYPTAAAPNSASPGYDRYTGRRLQKPATAYDLLFLAEGGRLIPPDVADTLKVLTPPPAPMAIGGLDRAPSVPIPRSGMEEPVRVLLAETEQGVFHDLAATLNAVERGEVRVGATTRLPTLATLGNLRAQLLAGDYFGEDDGRYERADDAIRPFALVVLVQAAGWAVAGPKGSRLELTKSGRALLGQPLGAADVRQAWERWLKSDLLDELSRVRAIKGQQSKSARLTKPSVRRGTLAAILGACPVGRWVALDELFRYVRAHHLGPTIERSEHSSLYVGWSMEAGWLEYAGTDYWDVVVGTYLRAVLWEYVATLGLIDIAYTYPEDSARDVGRLYGFDDEYLSRYDGLLGVRLTPLGAYVLGLADEYRPALVDPSREKLSLRVLPNLDLVVLDMAALTPMDRLLLERVGVPQSQGVYRLDRERILEATAQGVTLERVRELLVRNSGVAAEELPQTVRVFLADIDRRASAIRETGRMVLLESKDPYLLAELANKPSLRAFVCLASIADRPALLVPEAHQARARRELLKLGYVPQRP